MEATSTASGILFFLYHHTGRESCSRPEKVEEAGNYRLYFSAETCTLLCANASANAMDVLNRQMVTTNKKKLMMQPANRKSTWGRDTYRKYMDTIHETQA